MIRMRASILSLFFFLFVSSAFAQTFPCDGRLILSTKRNNTSVFRIGFGPFGAIYYNPVTLYLNEGFDALGFNPKDNYIYGVQENTNSIVQLRSDGSYEVIGSVPLVSTLNSFAGDCSPEGLYLCHDNELDQILIFDVVNGFELVDQLDLFWNPASQNSGPFTTRIDDFAIDPNNPTLAYAFQGDYLQEDLEPDDTRGYLLSINLDFNDPNVGMVTPIAPIASEIILQLGGLFFTQTGGLFGYGSYTTGFDVEQNRLVSINPFTGNAIVQGLMGPSAPASDGCSCPYSLSFENDVNPRDVTCSNSEVTFTLTINNRSNEQLLDLVLTDTIPEGMIIEEVSGDFIGTIANGTGVGTRFLTINDFQIAAKELIQISIRVNVIDIPTGLISNQAFLSNLPPLFDGLRLSDDPSTPGFVGDDTSFFSDPRTIDNVQVIVTPPSNCLNPNDAQIQISSPVLLANQPYRIKLINQIGWDELDFDVLVNNGNTFTIEDLGPGEYQLAQVTPEDSQCSFKWRDTTILIDPPNEQLQATAESNSPVCEGSTLQLNGTISPEGTVVWTGPAGFSSSNLSPRIDSAIQEQSGTFEMIATYGACEQIREIEVFIPPDIEASIVGNLEYCERERMQLMAEGNGDLTNFQWLGPDNLLDTSQQLEVLSMAPSNDGLYQLIIDNGYCMDTASATISVLPSPTISLPESIRTDFCGTIALNPEITGDSQVNYSWTPNEGLSCYDCPTPELLVPFQPNYQLTVINELLCTDTSEVSIALSRGKLIYVPNVFTPNFDGINDYFQLFPGCGVSSMRNLKIMDRWGSLIFSNENVNPSDIREFWDGKVKGKIGAAGVYIWQIEIELVDGTTKRLFGDINLLR